MFVKSLQRFEKIALILLLFLLPTQLAFHFWPPWAFVFGIRVDFLSPSIYATDILVAILFVISLLVDKKTLSKSIARNKYYILALLLFVITNIVFSVSPFVSIYKWIKVIEFTFLAYYFSKQKTLGMASIIKILLLTSSFFSLIGILQFFSGGTLGGILYYLGERTFNMSTPGIALVAINGAEHLRAYSTFSHPNSLAGFLGIVIILVLTNGHLKDSKTKIPALVISLVCFVVAFSLSAYIGISTALLFWLISKYKKLFKYMAYIFLSLSIFLSLLMPMVSSSILKVVPGVSQNLSQRLDLAAISGKLISHNFFFGGGLGTFVIGATRVHGFTNTWLLQPVHNISLLIFTEIGLIGLLAFCFLLYKVFLKSPLLFLFIIVTGLTDHYWLTLQQNTLLLSILYGISFRISTWRKS
jgi:hypothetical protein